MSVLPGTISAFLFSSFTFPISNSGFPIPCFSDSRSKGRSNLAESHLCGQYLEMYCP